MRTDKCQRPPGDLAPEICTPLTKRIYICNTRTRNACTNQQRTHLKFCSGQFARLFLFVQLIGQIRDKVTWICLLQEVTNTAVLLLRRLTEALSLKKSAIPANSIFNTSFNLMTVPFVCAICLCHLFVPFVCAICCALISQ